MVDNPSLDFAIYSIKAVAHMAGISEPTLRAWEKRYKILSPGRTESGHRRYTKRDIYQVIWLKNRLAEGMSISQAATLLQTQSETALLEIIEQEKQGVLGEPGLEYRKTPVFVGSEVRSPDLLAAQLVEALVNYDETTADLLLAEAASIYPPETVCVDIIQNILVEIGERWARNEVTIAAEHFSSTLCRARLNAMLEALPVNDSGPLVLTACAPLEFHEIGVVITTYFLRRYGWRTIYLGQNLPAIDLERDLQRLKPALLVFSACRTESALLLAQEILPVVERVRRQLPRLTFAYAGQAFISSPLLHEFFAGQLYFGDDVRQSTQLMKELYSKSLASG